MVRVHIVRAGSVRCRTVYRLAYLGAEEFNAASPLRRCDNRRVLAFRIGTHNRFQKHVTLPA